MSNWWSFAKRKREKQKERETEKDRRQLRQRELYVQKHTNRGMRAMSLRKAVQDRWKRYRVEVMGSVIQ